MPIITPNNSSQINPQTGLAYSTQELEIRRRAGALASQAQSLSPLDERFNITGNNLNMSQNELETFTDRDVNLQVDGANEEIRAERQSTTEKLANGVIKFGGKTLTATAGGILGPVIGIPAAIKDGSFNSFFDNDYQRWLDSMNESMDTNLPNYKTKEEQDAGFFKSLGTANFWADDFLGAMSFTAGAILTEYATAGLGSLGIANKIMSPLQKAARAKEVLKGLDLVSNLNAFGKAANVTRQLITGAGYEAGVEARQFKDEARKSAIAGFMQTHDGQEPNEQELADIESHVNNTANAVFAANMSIVGLSNFLQYPKIFGLGTKAEIGLFGKVGLIGEQGVYKGAYTEAKGLTKGLYTAGKILERPVEEGLWEEGMQSTVQNAAQNYITNMYSLDGLTNQKDIFDSLGDAFAESYGTKEGWKSIGMGMMIGGIGSPSFRYNKAEGIGSLWSGGVPDALKELRDTQKNIDNLATKNNNFNVAQIAEQAKQNRAIFEASKRYDAAVERGDMFEAKSAEHDVLFAMTAARHEAGLAGNFKTDLTKHIDSLTDEQFADTYGYTNKTAEELQARKIEVKEKAIKKVDQHIKAIEKAKQLLPSEDSQDEGRKNMQLGLAYAITGIEDLDAREDELSEFIASKVNGVITNDLKSINSIKRLTKDQNEKLSEYKKELKKLNSLKETYDRAVTFSPSDKDEEQYKKRQTEASTKIEDQEKVLKEKEKELKDVKKIINEAKKANYDYAEIDSFRDSVSKIMKINELKEKAKLANPLDKQDIEAAFNDLDKIASRRHDLLDTYNKLFTKAGQKEVDTMTKQMLKQLQAFGIHIANPEANLRAMAQMELQRTGKTINEFGKVVPIEDNTEATDEAIKDALDKLSTKVDDTSKNIFKDVQDLLEEAPITLAELNTFIQKLTLLEKSLQQDKNKYSDEDTQLLYDDFLMNIMDRLTEAKAQLVTLKAGVKEAANTPFAATVNNPSDVFTLFQKFTSPEVQSMVSALSNEDLKGRVRIKIEDLPEEMKTKSLLEKIPGSGVFLKNGHTKKEGKGIYVYLDDVRIGGLFDPRRFVHKNGKEMIISENNPALIKLINPDFVAPDNTLTDTGKKFVRYYKAMKNFYETTLDVKDELTPEETEKLLSFQVIAERFVKYADENKPYSERPKIATEFSDPKWNVEIPGIFKGLIVFNRLKLDDEYRTGEYIFIRSEGKTSWEKPDDNLKSQIQDFINKQAKESNLTIGWGSMSQYGLLVKTNESGKNLRVVDVGVPTLTVEDKKGFMTNLITQVKEAAEQFNDPNFDKTVVNKTLLDERGNEYFVPLLTGKEKKEGALKTQLNFSVFKNGDVSIGLEIYYKGKNYYVNVKKIFKESITVESIEKVVTFDKLIGRLDSYLAYNLSEESATFKEGKSNKSSLYNTPIAKFEPSLSLNDPIRRMPDLEGNEDLFEQMVVNSNVVFGNHNIQVKPKDAETAKYDVNNPLPKTQVKTSTTTPKGITPAQKEALNKALEPNATVIDMIGIYGDLKPKIASLDKDTIQKLNTISNRIKEIRKKLGYTNAEEDEIEVSDIEAKKADVILPIGISGSGKSTWIKSINKNNQFVVISPDEMRIEFTGNINDKSRDKEIYEEAAKRAVQAVKQGKQVIFDTTNLTKEKRRPFIQAIKAVLPNANIQYKLLPLNPELAKQRIKADIEAGINRANVSDATIDRHADSYNQMLEDIKSEDISEYDAELAVLEQSKTDIADIQQEYKTLKEELDELDAKISLNVNDKADEVRRVEVKAKVAELANKIKEEKAKKVDDEDSVVFSTSMTPTSDRMEYEKALNTLKRILPDFISVAEIDTLIKNIQNKGETWGAFMDKIVYLNKSKAGVGTEYHEAFHAVFRLLLTNTEIDSYYDAASKRYGTPSKAQLDSLKSESSAYKSLSYKSLRKLFYEEKMADDFKKYALNKDKESKTGFTGWLKNLFDKFLRMFNAISDKREELDILFSNIYSGSFKNAKEKYNIFSKNAKPAFSLLKTNDPLLEGSDPISTLSRFKSEKLIHTIAAKLFSNVIESKGYYTEKDLNEVIDNIKARYSPDNYTEELKRLYANAGLKAVTKARKDILEFKNALEREDNITIIKDDVQTIIKELYDVSLDEDFEESKNEQDTGRNEFEERSMSSVGGMNSLSKKMKQYMNMTMYYTDEFGLGITPEELNQEKYQVAINGSELYQGLERLLANTNKTQLFEKLYQYKSSNVNADAFYNKIVQDIADDISSNFESVENMLRDLGNIENDQVQLESAYKQLSSSPAFNSFIIAFNKNKVKYFKVLYDAKKGNIKGINANDQDVDTIQFEKWKSNFISKQLTKGQVDEILSNIRSMMNNYNFNTKKEDLNSAINSIKSEFGKLGIDLSFGFIKYSLVTKHADTVNKIAMTGNQYVQELVKFIDIFSDVIPLQTYESLIEGEDKDMFKVLREKNRDSFLGDKEETGESVTAGFFADNIKDGEEVSQGVQTRLKQLAENNAIFDESVGESTFQNAGNKTVFDKVFPSYITQAITSLKENVLTQSDLNDVLSLKEAYRVRGTILSDYQAGVLLQVLQNNPLLKGLNYNSKSVFSEDSQVTDFIFNNMQVFIMDGLKQESLDEDSFGGTQEQGKTYKDLDKRAKALMMLSMFADTTQKFSKKVLEGFNPEGTRLFILGTNEAKSTTVGVNLPVQNFFANGNLTELGLAYFNYTFKQEYERIQKIVKELKVLQDKLNNNEPLVNYSHGYHGEIPFIRSIQFNDEGNITNWDSLEKVPRGLKFFQFAKMQNVALLNKQAVEGALLPEVNGELQNFAKSQLNDYLEMLSKSDVDILKKVQETIQTKGEKQIRFTEETSSGYRERTIKNASADATIALATDFNTGGEKLTKSSVLNQNKKYIPIDTNKLEVTNELVKSIVDDLNEVNAKTLNIAGNGIYTMKK
jgi:predicted kinase